MKKIILVLLILLFTASMAYAFRLPLWYPVYGTDGTVTGTTYWESARTTFWSDARTTLWSTPRNTEIP